MAGRGAIPVQLSSDFIAAIRHDYVETDKPVREMSAEYGISVGKINRLMRNEGWPRRIDRPPRPLPPALKLREAARVLAAQPRPSPPSCPAIALQRTACSRTPMGRASTPFQSDSKTWMAGTSPAMTAESDSLSCDPPSPGLASLGHPLPQAGEGETAAARIEALVLKELAAEEAARAQLGAAPRDRVEAEKIARTLAAHTQTLQTLRRLRAGSTGAPQSEAGPTRDDANHHDDLPADLDELREALAQRIEAFVASQPDDEDAGEADAARAVLDRA